MEYDYNFFAMTNYQGQKLPILLWMCLQKWFK